MRISGKITISLILVLGGLAWGQAPECSKVDENLSCQKFQWRIVDTIKSSQSLAPRMGLLTIRYSNHSSQNVMAEIYPPNIVHSQIEAYESTLLIDYPSDFMGNYSPHAKVFLICSRNQRYLTIYVPKVYLAHPIDLNKLIVGFESTAISDYYWGTTIPKVLDSMFSFGR